MMFEEAVSICEQVPRLTKRNPGGEITVTNMKAALEKLANYEDAEEAFVAIANGMEYGGDVDAAFVQKTRRVKETAQMILDARALYPDKSLAELYDEATMPPELRAAHEANDRAVMDLYGFPPDMPEQEMTAELFKRYQQYVEQGA